MYASQRKFFILNVLLLTISLNLFTSCNKKNSNRIDLSDSVQYLETPKQYSIDNVKKIDNFKKLDKEDMHNVNALLKNKNNYIWLKIDFTIPSNLRNKDLGLFLAQLKSADRVWVNNHQCGHYGSFPPNELSAGFCAQYFNINQEILNIHNLNTIFIQIWTGCPVSISDNMFIGEQNDVSGLAEISTFFTSKLILCFIAISFIVFIIYTMLYIFLRKAPESKTFLYYSILMISSIITLIPFCINELPWIKPVNVSYFTMMKFLLTLGIFSTVYFVNNFMVSYMGYKENITIKIIRLVIYIVPVAVSLMATSYNQISGYMLFFYPVLLSQFIFTVYQIIKGLIDKSNRKNVIILLLSIIPACVGFIIDICFNKYTQPQLVLPLASIYGWQISSYIFIIRLLKRFSNTFIKNTKLKNSMVKFNAKLENEVEFRTKELSEKNFILSRGLEAITLVQQEVLPKKNKTFRGWDIAVNYIPLDSEISGDLYDYYFTNSKLDGLSIIDISGHGIQAGLMSILAKGIISQQYISGIKDSKSLSDILNSINKIYIKEKVNVENYFTGLLFNFEDFNKKDICKIQVANAGHPAPLLYNAEKDNITEIKYKNPEKQYGFIGVDGLPVSFPATEFTMGQNDILVCFTDGITEAMNKQHEEFSKERIAKVITENKELPAAKIKEKIMAELDNFLGTQHLTDDLTLIVLKRNNSKDYLEEI